MKCGKKNYEESCFCIQCGENLKQTKNTIEQTNNNQIHAQFNQQNNNKEQFIQSCNYQSQQQLATKNNYQNQQDIIHNLSEDILNNDTMCKKCGHGGCVPNTVTNTKVNTKSGFTEACCGMLIFGPIGILCGLCGHSTSVSQSSKTWWNCANCGSKHVSKANADASLNQIITSVYLAIICAIVFGSVFLYEVSVWIGLILIGLSLLVTYALEEVILAIATDNIGYDISKTKFFVEKDIKLAKIAMYFLCVFVPFVYCLFT